MKSDGDGSDIFWPGYVDAISNLVLNLLFVVAILTIAVFLFAIELGRKQGLKIGAVDKDKGTPVKSIESKQDVEKKRLEDELSGMRKQVASLRAAEKAANAAKEAAAAMAVKAAEAEAAAQAARPAEAENATAAPPAVAPENGAAKPPAVAPEPQEKSDGAAAKTPPKRVDATEKQPAAEKEIDRISYNGAAVVVVFHADSVTLTKDEQGVARKALGNVVASGGARIEVRVPGSFSEARRLAFYRSMAVRNLLIEMELPVEKIDMAIREVKAGGDSTKVFIRGLK